MQYKKRENRENTFYIRGEMETLEKALYEADRSGSIEDIPVRDTLKEPKVKKLNTS
jgi:hypothetical protein